MARSIAQRHPHVQFNPHVVGVSSRERVKLAICMKSMSVMCCIGLLMQKVTFWLKSARSPDLFKVGVLCPVQQPRSY